VPKCIRIVILKSIRVKSATDGTRLVLAEAKLSL